VQNFMVTNEGVMLIDFERVAWVPPELDLGVTATEYGRVAAGHRRPARRARITAARSRD
jgi:thiamine kinase-like enzyme